MRRLISRAMVRVALGTPQQYGLPAPDHRLFETHPIINSEMLYEVGHGRIRPVPDVARLDGDGVVLADQRRIEVDVIVFATGYRISFPFLDVDHLNWRDGRPDLYLNVFHPERDDVFVAGLIQPDSGQWGLADYQAQAIARFIRAADSGASSADRLRRRKRTEHPDLGRGIGYVQSTRHLVEVEHFSYRRRLQKLIAQLG